MESVKFTTLRRGIRVSLVSADGRMSLRLVSEASGRMLVDLPITDLSAVETIVPKALAIIEQVGGPEAAAPVVEYAPPVPYAAIGRSWDSPEGRKTISEVVLVGERRIPMFAVDIAERPSAMRALFAVDDAKGLEQQITFDEKSVKAHAASALRQAELDAAEAARRSAAEDTDGFADRMEPMRRAKVLAALNTQIRVSGVVVSRKEAVRARVAEGWTIRPHAKDVRRFIALNGTTFVTEADYSKTALDYAAYLIGQKTPAAAEPVPETPALPEFVSASEGKPPAKFKHGDFVLYDDKRYGVIQNVRGYSRMFDDWAYDVEYEGADTVEQSVEQRLTLTLAIAVSGSSGDPFPEPSDAPIVGLDGPFPEPSDTPVVEQDEPSDAPVYAPIYETERAVMRREIRETIARVKAIAAASPHRRMKWLLERLPIDRSIDNEYRSNADLREMLVEVGERETEARGIASEYAPKPATEDAVLASTPPVSVFVALWPSPEDAARMALPDGAPAEDLHATLVFLGKHAPDDVRLKKLTRDLLIFAAGRPPVTAITTSYDVFQNERATMYLALQAPSVVDLRRDVVEVCKGAGFTPDTTHGFIPHITVSGKEPMKFTLDDAPALPLRFAEIVLVVGREKLWHPMDESERSYAIDYAIGERSRSLRATERATDARAALVSFLAQSTAPDLSVSQVAIVDTAISTRPPSVKLGQAEIAAVLAEHRIVAAELPSVPRSALNVAMLTAGRVSLRSDGTATLDGALTLIEEDGAPDSEGASWAEAWTEYATKARKHAGLYALARTKPAGWTRSMPRLIAECLAPDVVEVLTSPYAELDDLERTLLLIEQLENDLELVEAFADVPDMPDAPDDDGLAPSGSPRVTLDTEAPIPTADPAAPRNRYGDVIVVLEGMSSGLDLRSGKPVRTDDKMIQVRRYYTGEWKSVGSNGSTPVYFGGGIARLSTSADPAYVRGGATLVWEATGDSYATQGALVDARSGGGDVVMQYGKLAKRDGGVYLALTVQPGGRPRATWWFELLRGMIVRVTNDQSTALSWVPASDDYAGMKTWAAEQAGGENSIPFREAATPNEEWAGQAILYLESMDQDRASEENGVGFNQGHSGPGMVLANTLRYRGGLTDDQWKEAFEMARVYSKTQVGLPPGETKKVKPAKVAAEGKPARAKLAKTKAPKRLLDVLTGDSAEAWSDETAMQAFIQRMPLINDCLNDTTPAIVQARAELQSEDKRWWRTMQFVEEADNLTDRSFDTEDEAEWVEKGQPQYVLRVHAENAIDYGDRFYRAMQTDGVEYAGDAESRPTARESSAPAATSSDDDSEEDSTSQSKYAPENQAVMDVQGEEIIAAQEPETAAAEAFGQETMTEAVELADTDDDLRCEDGSAPPCVSTYRAPARTGKVRKPKRKRAFVPIVLPAGELVMDQTWMLTMVEAGALFVMNHSGGKDSQAAMIRLLAFVPPTQMVVIHANLPGAEWPGTQEHAQAQAEAAGVPFIVVTAKWSDKNGGKEKTFLNAVLRRHRLRPEVPSFPSKAQRWCTSDLKRGPLTVAIRAYANKVGKRLIVDVEGLRAEESDDRENCPSMDRPEKLQTSTWQWYKYRPIKHMLTGEVFQAIADAGQRPHYAYYLGNERLSCALCIYGSDGDIRNAALYLPDIFAEYVAAETSTGYGMHMGRRPLEEIAGVTVAEAYAQRRRLPILTDTLRGKHKPLPVLPMASGEVIEPPAP